MTNSETIKPEVGQLWLDCEERKMFLFMVTEKYLHFLRRRYRTSQKEPRVVIFTQVRDAFNKRRIFKYIGKAKGSISDLFEVKYEN